MTSKNTLIIGTRGSALALAQADMVRAALSALHPGLDIRREIIRTTGDRRTDVPLADVARVSGIVDKGIFIKELETALLEGRIDVAVHREAVPCALGQLLLGLGQVLVDIVFNGVKAFRTALVLKSTMPAPVKTISM